MSYKIINQIKKSNLSRPLKSVLEAYVSFANRDGTSIRPTEAAVGARASMSRSAVSHHTQILQDLGLLVHDKDEHGIFLKHAYGDNGVWAYVYHVDARKLTDPALVKQWEMERKAFIEKCRIAGAKNTTTRWAKGVSGNPSGQSKLLHSEQRDLRQTLPEGFATNPPEGDPLVRSRGFCDTDPTLKSDPSPKDYRSAVSTAVSQNQVSELVSEKAFASLTPLILIGKKNGKAYDQHSRLWIEAGEQFNFLFPNKPIRDKDITLLLDLADEIGHGNLSRGWDRVKQAWTWNQAHKKGRMLLYSLDELAKALRSTNDRSLLNQMDRHDHCPLCVDEPPGSAAPPNPPAQVADPEPALCHHMEPQGSCQECEDEAIQKDAIRHRCQHGNDDRRCDECLHPRNAECRNRNCKKWFHSTGRTNPYCSPECAAEVKAMNEALAKKYAKPESKVQLAAFLDGEAVEP